MCSKLAQQITSSTRILLPKACRKPRTPWSGAAAIGHLSLTHRHSLSHKLFLTLSQEIALSPSLSLCLSLCLSRSLSVAQTPRSPLKNAARRKQPYTLTQIPPLTLIGSEHLGLCQKLFGCARSEIKPPTPNLCRKTRPKLAKRVAPRVAVSIRGLSGQWQQYPKSGISEVHKSTHTKDPTVGNPK